MLPGFSMLVHGKSAKFWPIKRFYSLPRVRLREAHKDLYSANLKQKKERKEGTRRKARNPEGRKGTGSKGQRKKIKKDLTRKAQNVLNVSKLVKRPANNAEQKV